MREPPGPCGAGRLRCAYAFVAECLCLRVGAGGRRPAREIATRELRSEWSISKPGQALPPPTGTAAGPPVSSTQVEQGVLMIGSACLLEARPGPAAAWLVLLGRAAVCAGGRRPAREIATRELRSEWSISKPGQAPQASRRPRSVGLVVCVLTGSAVAHLRRGQVLQPLRRPPHRRGLVCWCVVRRSVISHAIRRPHCAGLYQFVMLRHLCL